MPRSARRRRRSRATSSSSSTAGAPRAPRKAAASASSSSIAAASSGGDGSEPRRRVVVGLDAGPAGAERDERAEHRIAAGAEDQLRARAGRSPRSGSGLPGCASIASSAALERLVVGRSPRWTPPTSVLCSSPAMRAPSRRRAARADRARRVPPRGSSRRPAAGVRIPSAATSFLAESSSQAPAGRYAGTARCIGGADRLRALRCVARRPRRPRGRPLRGGKYRHAGGPERLADLREPLGCRRQREHGRRTARPRAAPRDRRRRARRAGRRRAGRFPARRRRCRGRRRSVSAGRPVSTGLRWNVIGGSSSREPVERGGRELRQPHAAVRRARRRAGARGRPGP